jgi:hypothetical protein
VLGAVGEGRFSLDDTLSHWLPGVLPRLDESAITVRMLLSHVVEALPRGRRRTPLSLVSFSLWYLLGIAPGGTRDDAGRFSAAA